MVVECKVVLECQVYWEGAVLPYAHQVLVVAHTWVLLVGLVAP